MKKKKSSGRNTRTVFAALICAVMLTAALMSGCEAPPGADVLAVAEPEYPTMARYPAESEFLSASGTFDDVGYSAAYDAWRDSREALLGDGASDASGLDGFFASGMTAFLSGADGGNRVYSPINVYMVLAMLAEITDGDTRAQLLDVLGADSIDSLRATAKAVWGANYCDDGTVKSILANSLWLDNDITFNSATLKTLAEQYYAASFSGDMGSEELNAELRTWLNEQTGGLLEEQASNLELNRETIMALASTVYYNARWADEFAPAATEPDVFHAPAGDLTCDYLHQSNGRYYYWGEHFSAVDQRLQNSGAMWLVLPDEGTDVESLLSDPEVLELLNTANDYENKKYLTVHLSLPKFDVASDFDLVDGLKELGVTDVFSARQSDFSPLTSDTDEVFVSRADHAARVVIDEEGCTAAAYTVIQMATTGMPPDESVDMVIDRPFLFAIMGDSGMPLFIGIVNIPA